ARQVEAELEAERGDRLRRRAVAQDRLGEIAGQRLDAEEDQQRDDEERDDRERQAAGDQPAQAAHERFPPPARRPGEGRDPCRREHGEWSDALLPGAIAASPSHALLAARWAPA